MVRRPCRGSSVAAEARRIEVLTAPPAAASLAASGRRVVALGAGLFDIRGRHGVSGRVADAPAAMWVRPIPHLAVTPRLCWAMRARMRARAHVCCALSGFGLARARACCPPGRAAWVDVAAGVGARLPRVWHGVSRRSHCGHSA